jgi:hypothetical protein
MTQKIILSMAAAVFLIGSGCGAGEETREVVEAAASSGAALQISQGIRTADRTACRANMMTLATTMEIYYAANSSYPENVEDLRSAGGTSFNCPSSGIPYRLAVTGEGSRYTLTCPAVPSHGCITDGNPDWN